MTVDWQKLAPHKPVDPGVDAYVERSRGGAREITEWVLAGGSALLVGGPAGVGKSTELAQVATMLQQQRVACLAPLDRWENVRRLTPERLLLRLAGRLVYVATQSLGLALSDQLRAHLVGEGVLTDGTVTPLKLTVSPRAVLRQAIAEVSRLSSQGRIAFLIDGLERTTPEQTPVLFEELAALPDTLDAVVIVPWHTMFGIRPDAVIRPGERFFSVRALEVEGEAGEAGREFLANILARRLAMDPPRLQGRFDSLLGAGDQPIVAASTQDIVDDAARWSGGIPRTFLQLAADAGTYARLHRGADWPNPNDLTDAVADQQDSFRRLLLPGDTAAIRAVMGTDGRELDLPRRIRLLAHGLLLERVRDRRPILEVHPLLRAVLQEEVSDA